MNEESANGRFGPLELAQKAKAKGYRWIAYQLNDHILGPTQQARWPLYQQAAIAEGLWDTCWLTRPFDGPLVRRMCIETGCRGIILEGEIPGHRPEAVDWVDVIFHLKDIDIPKAVVTNFAPFVHADGTPWPEKAKPLIDDGWACITECFITEAPNATPERTDDYATRVLGWAETQPMVEGWHLEDYGDLSRFRNVSHWDAGNVLRRTQRV